MGVAKSRGTRLARLTYYTFYGSPYKIVIGKSDYFEELGVNG
jgi:hypothetical protein